MSAPEQEQVEINNKLYYLVTPIIHFKKVFLSLTSFAICILFIWFIIRKIMDDIGQFKEIRSIGLKGFALRYLIYVQVLVYMFFIVHLSLSGWWSVFFFAIFLVSVYIWEKLLINVLDNKN